MTPHIMVDLETLGVGNSPVILSIGAAKFNETEIVDSFHVAINPETCTPFQLTIDAGTVMWWLDGDRQEARAALLGNEMVDLHSALRGFSQWMGEPVPMWGNGASSDNVWLRSAYTAIGDECPWPFYLDRCYRTMKNLAPGIAIEREGCHHDALADATCQAKHLQQIVAHLGVSL